MTRPATELEVFVFVKSRNLFEWRLYNAQGETIDSGRAATVAQARLDGLAATNRRTQVESRTSPF